MVKQKKINKLYSSCRLVGIVIETKETLLKAKEGHSDCVVTRSISHFRRIQKDNVFPNNTSHESDNDFE